MSEEAQGKETYKGVYLASGSTHPDLASDIAKTMGTDLGPVERRDFPNTERYIRYQNSVRDDHVFIIQSLASANGMTVNDSFVELMLMVDAAKRSSAREVTVVAPYLAYSRQDRKARGREPISAAVIIRALQSVGTDRIVSVDMHSAQTQAVFNGPFDHLIAEPLIRNELKKIVGKQPDNFMVVSPDGGRAKASEDYSNSLSTEVVHMPKRRNRQNSSLIERPGRVEGVGGKTSLLVDDMIDTAGTLVSAADTLRDSGAKEIIVAATHGIFSGEALNRLANSPIDRIVVTDTLPQDKARERLGDRLTVISSADIIGRALSEIATGGSVSKIFDDRNNS